MTLQEGYNIINQIPNKPFSEIFEGQDLSDIIKNKGKTGQLIETIVLKLNLSSTHLDFSDGELKTNKVKSDGTPDETMAICMIAEIFDSLMDATNLTQTYPMKKIENWIYLPCDKSSIDPKNWKTLPPIHINRNDSRYKKWYEQLDKDYQFAISQIKINCDNGKNIATTDGRKHYIQFRTKGAGHGTGKIFSKKYNRYVSDQSYAIYLTKYGLKELLKYAR